MKNKFSDQFIIITGASSGLGKAFAKKFATDGCHLILLSLPDENLSFLSKDLTQKYGIQVLFFETDLSKEKNIREFTKWLLSKNLSPVGLVNNAGIGGSAIFDETSDSLIDTMILVNIRAVTLLSRILVPELKKRECSFILNISSIAAFIPMPFKTVYPASKAFVYSFSVGLGEELKGSSVQVSVVHPGPMDTSDENGGRIDKHGLVGKLVRLSTEDVADIAVRNLLNGKKVIVPGVFNKILIRMMKTIPRVIAMPLITKVLRKEIESL